MLSIAMIRFATIYVVILGVSLFTGRSTATPPDLHVPTNWRVENTPYPPPWAKTLPWKGTLQLRFPPGFFMPEHDFSWSYPIMYVLQGNVLKSVSDLKLALKTYDAGLYGDQFPITKINVTLIRKNRFPGPKPMHILFDGFDPFTTKKELRTHMVIYRRFDERTQRTILLILRSRRPPDPNDPVWKSLLKFPADIGF